MIKEKLKRGTLLYKLYLHYQLFFRYKLFYKRKNYSQFDEDLFLTDFFKDKRKGRFVDLGAFHPVRYNNTYLLYKKGWEGINIDLDKFNIDLFNFNRPKDFNVNQAISDKIGKDKLYFYHEKSPINTLDGKISELQKATVRDIVEISTNTLTNIIDRSPYNKIDLLSIDVEGYEFCIEDHPTGFKIVGCQIKAGVCVGTVLTLNAKGAKSF